MPSLPFLNADEQARLDALPEDVAVSVADLLTTANRLRPDLNQPGMLGDFLDAIERYVARDDVRERLGRVGVMPEDLLNSPWHEGENADG